MAPAVELRHAAAAVASAGRPASAPAIVASGRETSRQETPLHDAPAVAALSDHQEGVARTPGPIKRAVFPASLAVSGIMHMAAIAAFALTFAAVQPFTEADSDVIEISVVNGVPQPPSVSLPPPAPPPATLPADLLAGPDLPAPAPPPRMLPAELLAAPELPAPAPPPALPLALVAPPKVAMPPPAPNAAEVLATAVARQEPKVIPKVAPKVMSKTAPKTAKPAADARRLRELRKKRLEAARRMRIERSKQAAKERAERRRAAVEARNKARARAASRRAASAGSSASAGSRASAAAYSGIVAARLRRNMPSGDLARVGQGTAYVAFRISASGAATGIRLTRSAGHSALDRAAVAMVRRASPFPAPPPGARRSFRVPVRFRR
ncbi:MAG: TonB family protein [Hyphomicrobiales bacterium]|nr:TonB family protein [Hyphomicrobiales bacterium]